MNAMGIKRRRFFQTVAGGLAAPYFVPGWARGADGGVAPSERIVCGSIGVGSQGNAQLRAFLSHDTAQVVAVCDPYEHKRQVAQKAVETRYAEQTGKGDYRGCKTYGDFRELIGRDDIDAVVIASPGHWHAIQAVAAIEAGKDVYGEKPLSVTIDEGRAMCRAVRRHSRVFQTGTHMRSMAHVRRAG